MNKKVLIAGTFDLIHPGHLFLINEAAKLGDVFVIVSTDKNRELYSGEAPIVPEQQRLEVIKRIKNVKAARLGRSDNDTLKTVEEIYPDIILLGPNQKYDIATLKKGLKDHGLEHIKIQRLQSYYNYCELNSSRLIKQKILERFRNKKL
ncbi:MAG: FAD synthase [Candidatus Lokiarchaeota archaeon]|nr:FAD synthase [Candidatus Lokiarchaeota archaeon]